MKTKMIIVLSLLLCGTSPSQAFDGNRKGFTLGCGLGMGRTIYEAAGRSAGKSDVATSFSAGYAWNEQNEVALWSSGASKEGFHGLVYTRYFAPAPGKAYYLHAGAGLRYSHRFRKPSFIDFGPHWPKIGLGLMVGGGYEFAPHYQVHSGISYGTIDNAGRDYHIWQVQLALMALAF